MFHTCQACKPTGFIPSFKPTGGVGWGGEEGEKANTGPSFKFTGVQESENFCASYFTNLSINLIGIWCGVERCWSGETHSFFCLITIQGREFYLLNLFCINTIQEREGDWNSSVGRVLGLLSCKMQRHGFNPPLSLRALSPFPKNSLWWECKPRSSVCRLAFHCTDWKNPDIHVLDGWMPATKKQPACTIHEDKMWLSLQLDYEK